MPYDDEDQIGLLDAQDEEEKKRQLLSSAGAMSPWDSGHPTVSETSITGAVPSGLTATPGLDKAKQEAATQEPQSITGPSQPLTQPNSITAGPLEPKAPMGPAATREQQLLGQGPPEYHGIKKVLDVLGRVTAPGAAIEQRTGLGTLGYESKLGQASSDAAKEATLAKGPLDVSYEAAKTQEQQAKAKKETATANASPRRQYENIQQLHADAVQEAIAKGVDPSKDPKVLQIEDSIQRIQKEPTARPDNDTIENQRYEKIQQAANMKQPVSPEDHAWAQAYEKRHTLGPEKTFALANAPLPPIKPDDPNVAWVASGKGKLSDVLTFRTPLNERKAFIQAVVAANPNFHSYDNDVDKKIIEDLTSGGKSNTLLAYNTALRHMDTYSKIADEIDNGNVVALNALGNEIGKQFGSDKVTNLNLAKQVFMGEFGRAAEGSGVTVGDRKGIEESVSNASSPGQFKGAVKTAKTLLEGKRDAMKQQFGAGMSGSPDFGQATTEAGFKTPEGAPAAPKQDGKVLKADGKVIARSKGGVWVAP